MFDTGLSTHPRRRTATIRALSAVQSFAEAWAVTVFDRLALIHSAAFSSNLSATIFASVK